MEEEGVSRKVAVTVDKGQGEQGVADGSVHGIMCPLTGKVLEVNSDVQAKPSLVEKDPYFKGWLYRVLPSDPENNLQWLKL